MGNKSETKQLGLFPEIEQPDRLTDRQQAAVFLHHLAAWCRSGEIRERGAMAKKAMREKALDA